VVYLPEVEAVNVVMVNRPDADNQGKSTDLFLAIMGAFYSEDVDCRG